MNYFNPSLFFLFLCVLASSFTMGMQSQKPSLKEPTGRWEDADKKDREENMAKESLSLVFRNTNSMPLTLKSEQWEETIPAGKSLQKSCLATTPLEIFVHSKCARFQVKDILSSHEEAYLSFSLSSKELFIHIKEDSSVVFNDSLTLPLKSLSTEATDEDTSSDSSSIISFESIDSTVARPKPLQELLGILKLTKNN